MSSNIRVKRICEYCDEEFIAKTTVTRFCKDDCAKRAYKKRKRSEAIHKSQQRTLEIKSSPYATIQAKDFLSVREVTALLGLSESTVRRLITREILKAQKFGRRVIIKREHINSFFRQ